ncbi:MAG: hypothetical protein V7L01_05805 [Nostoc sp.]|uniref:hypothetical protein n=1 Tax=Nostoc sp. TaxID=1180 RepID=UPI002FF97E42
MAGKPRFEITDLIKQAVENALVRRNEALQLEDGYTSLSDEEAANIAGGLTNATQPIAPVDPTIIGFQAVCPAIKPELLQNSTTPNSITPNSITSG